MDSDVSDWEESEQVMDFSTSLCETINHEFISQLLANDLDLRLVYDCREEDDPSCRIEQEKVKDSSSQVETQNDHVATTDTTRECSSDESIFETIFVSTDGLTLVGVPSTISNSSGNSSEQTEKYPHTTASEQVVTSIVDSQEEYSGARTNDESDSEPPNDQLFPETTFDLTTVLSPEKPICIDNENLSSHVIPKITTDVSNNQETFEEKTDSNAEASSSSDSAEEISINQMFDVELSEQFIPPVILEKMNDNSIDPSVNELSDAISETSSGQKIPEEVTDFDEKNSVEPVILETTCHSTTEYSSDKVGVDETSVSNAVLPEESFSDKAISGTPTPAETPTQKINDGQKNVEESSSAIDRASDESSEFTLRMTHDDMSETLTSDAEVADLRRSRSVQYQTPMDSSDIMRRRNIKRNATIAVGDRRSYEMNRGLRPPMSSMDRVSCWDTMSISSDTSTWQGDDQLFQQTGYFDRFLDYSSASLDNYDIEKEGESSLLHFVSSQALNRVPWSLVNRVIDSNVLDTMTAEEKSVQEAKFEILTTEASYYKSLQILKNHYIKSSELSDASILSKADHSTLFSLIKPIDKYSKAFLRDLEKCWKRSIFLNGIFDIICQHSSHNRIYATYCSNLKGIKTKLTSLKSNKKFDETLKIVETRESCTKLPLESYLSLPMKRITSLDILLKKARSTLLKKYRLNKSKESEIEIESCLDALDSVQEICTRSDKDSQTNNRVKTMMEFSQKLKYPDNIHQLALISPDRWLVMHGEVRLHGYIDVETASKKKSKPRFKKANVVMRLFLLSDILILTKKKGKNDDGYKMLDHCRCENINMASRDSYKTLSDDITADSDRQYKILLIMEENFEKKRVEMVLSCALQTERDLWVSHLKQKSRAIDSGVTARHMVCVYPYAACDPGHLFLNEGDEVTVTKILDNGWMEGVRMRGSKTGKFPPSRVDAKK